MCFTGLLITFSSYYICLSMEEILGLVSEKRRLKKALLEEGKISSNPISRKSSRGVRLVDLENAKILRKLCWKGALS